MEPQFERVLRRARPLGNAAEKYRRAIRRGGALLVARLEEAGRLAAVHLDRSAPSPAADLDAVAAAGHDEDESLALLGTFYAVQALHLNARVLERLAVDLAERSDRRAACAAFLRRNEDDFSALVGAYARRVLRIVAPAPLRRSFLLCAAGSRGHQDDIDVVVLVREDAARVEVERALARLTVQMLRHASALYHYVASRLGAGGMALSAREFTDALGRERLDVPAVTQLLRAEPLAGERALHDDLRRIAAPFLFRPGEDTTRHEHFLRGLLGEIRSLLLRPAPSGTVNPKEDALRLILGLLLALAAADGAAAHGARSLLRAVRARRPALRAALAQLEDSLVFLEAFHQLAHLLVAEEEDIAVEGPEAAANLRRIAEAMGYEDGGPVRGTDRLLVRYEEAVGAAREAAPALMEEIARHLRSSGRLAPFVSGRRTAGFAATFVEVARSYRGARFWDDVLEGLAAPGCALLDELASGLADPTLAEACAEWGRDAPYALLTIVTLLAERRPREGAAAAAAITRAYLGWLAVEAEHVRALSRTFRFYPGLLNRFLLALDRDALAALEERLDVAIGNPEVAAARDRFRAFIAGHRRTSRYVRRILARATARVPATVLALADDAALRTLAQGRLAASERHPAADSRKELLGDFYDIEFLRLVSSALREPAGTRLRAEYGELTRTYLGDLIDTCVREAERERGGRMLRRDRFGVYLAGAHARGRPFGEDYDVLALLDGDDAEERAVAERAVVLANRQIARRGLVVQYRLGERLGRFVATFEEVERLGRAAPADFFVDLHQALGARTIAGSRRVDAALVERVLRPFVFGDAERFAGLLAREIRERRRRLHARPEGTLHVKNMRGGLRELDLCLGACRARLGVHDPEAAEPFTVLAARDPAQAGAYEDLARAEALIVAVRSAYRVAVAATDVIEREYLGAPAALLGAADGDALFARLAAAGEGAAAAIDRLMGLASA